MKIAGGRGFPLALLVALLLHGLIISLLIMGFHQRAKPQIEWIELMPEGTLLGNAGSPAAIEAPEPAPMTPPAPTQPPTRPPEPMPQPAPPVPQPIPKPEAFQVPESARVAPKETVVKRPAKKKESIDVNLNEVTRRVTGKTKSETPGRAVPAEPALNVGQIREELQKRLGKMGVSGATGDGVSGIPGGRASGEIAAYYALIRDVYYQAWRQPGIPGRERLDAIVRVKIAKDGRVLSAALERASGDAAMDETVNAAMAAVKEIGRPPPPGLGSQFAEVTITFEF